ncbi:MAG: hypothetical protein FWE88_06395 [Phycisphaerae bacterium]|nr:hypothetical protein [Phycisphaerae bacterium]
MLHLQRSTLLGQKGPLVSRKSDNANPAAKRPFQRKSSKPPTFIPEFPVPRLDEYTVNYCPHCGLCLEAVHENYQKLFAHLNTAVPLPENVCPNCGLEYREMVIGLQSTRESTRNVSDVPL